MRWSGSVWLLLSLLGQVAIPRGTSIRVDGILVAGEWGDASVVPLGGGTNLYLKHDGEDLLIATQSPQISLVDVCILRGEQVRVFHSSASLGTAVYSRQGETWARITDFTWMLRDGSAVAPEDREKHLAEFGWVASTVGLGNATREFRLRRAALQPSDRIAVAVYSPVSGMSTWPTAVKDGCASVGFAMGTAAPTAMFEPASWSPLAFRD